MSQNLEDRVGTCGSFRTESVGLVWLELGLKLNDSVLYHFCKCVVENHEAVSIRSQPSSLSLSITPQANQSITGEINQPRMAQAIGQRANQTTTQRHFSKIFLDKNNLNRASSCIRLHQFR